MTAVPFNVPQTRQAGRSWSIPWRMILSHAPLPMLALAASYGVYRFSALFVPWYFALATAAAFETTYLGLAAQRNLTAANRRGGTLISVGAVLVSVIYNSLAGYIERQPAWADSLPWWGTALLAALHGAPLAIVAYFVADLLLHSDHTDPQVAILSQTIADLRAELAKTSQGAEQEVTEMREKVRDQFAGLQKVIADRDQIIAALQAELANRSQASQDEGVSVAGRALSWAQLADVAGVNASTLRSRIKKLEE